MSKKTLTHARLVEEFRSLWVDPARRRTLARIATHARQFENWWKFALATHLWELAEDLGAYVWVEADARADIVLAPAAVKAAQVPDLAATPHVPIELKTAGTFWQSPKKAYFGGKKALVHDMDAARNRARTARPFAAVALLVTHAGRPSDEQLTPFLETPRAMGKERGLVCRLDELVPLGRPHRHFPACAHQFVWTTPAARLR